MNCETFSVRDLLVVRTARCVEIKLMLYITRKLKVLITRQYSQLVFRKVIMLYICMYALRLLLTARAIVYSSMC